MYFFAIKQTPTLSLCGSFYKEGDETKVHHTDNIEHANIPKSYMRTCLADNKWHIEYFSFTLTIQHLLNVEQETAVQNEQANECNTLQMLGKHGTYYK